MANSVLVPGDRIRKFVVWDFIEDSVPLDFQEEMFWKKVAHEFAGKLREFGKVIDKTMSDGRIIRYTELDVVVPKMELIESGADQIAKMVGRF